jgi:hypothetical protein
MKVSKLRMAHQWRIRSMVTGSWAKKVDICDLKISSWTAEQEEAWISILLDLEKPPYAGFHAANEERVAHPRQAEWDRQRDPLVQIANNLNCELVPIIAPQP